MNKYEQLIDLIINENTEEASKLFHTIVVEKSREIYESLIDEEDFEEGFGHDKHDEVTSLVDEVDMDEVMSAMHEDEEEFDMDSEELPMDDEMGDDEMDMDHEMGAGEEELEDRVVDLEDALDELKAEFDRLMADEAGEEEHGGEDMDMDMDSEEGDEEEEEELDESIARRNKRVVKEYVTPMKHDFHTGQQKGETGQMAGTGAHSEKQGGRNKTSPVAGKNNMGGTAVISKGGNQDQDGSKPVKASNEYTKGEGKLGNAGKFLNVPGKDQAHVSYKHKEAAYGSGKQSDATGNMAGTGRNTPKQGETNVKSPLGRK
jgi:hypothetical protein